MTILDYDAQRDLAAVTRIWKEVGWIDSDSDAAAMEPFLEASACYVTHIDGQAECAVMTTPGEMKYQDTDLPLSVVSGVTTSLVGRKQGLAKRLTAHAVSRSAEQGAAVSILGMFEQGFYDLIGFGSGSYEPHIQFDPATLQIDVPYRPPVRLTVDDWEEVHQALHARERPHGGVRMLAAGFTRAEMMWTEKPFGLGYRSASGELTHFIWGKTKGESGPYHLYHIAYQDSQQMLELLQLIASLGDQVRSLRMFEPTGYQLQDFMRHVIRQKIATAKSDHAYRHTSGTWWQLRILDLALCVGARSYAGPPVRFVATLTDPIGDLVDDGWPGLTGSYVVTVGEESTVEPGTAAGLPELTASINAFSRMWWGVRPASSLAVTDRLAGPAALLADLDRALLMPGPHPGIYF